MIIITRWWEFSSMFGDDVNNDYWRGTLDGCARETVTEQLYTVLRFLVACLQSDQMPSSDSVVWIQIFTCLHTFWDRMLETLDHHSRAAVGLSKRRTSVLTPPLDLPVHRKIAIFELIRPFDHILFRRKFHDDISNGSRVIALTNRHTRTRNATNRRHWKQYHLRCTLSASLHGR